MCVEGVTQFSIPATLRQRELHTKLRWTFNTQLIASGCGGEQVPKANCPPPHWEDADSHYSCEGPIPQ